MNTFDFLMGFLTGNFFVIILFVIIQWIAEEKTLYNIKSQRRSKWINGY